MPDPFSASLAPTTDINAAEQAAKPALPQLVKTKDPKQAAQVAKQFEALVLGEMLTPMFQGVSKADKTFGGGHGEEAFQPLLIQEYGKIMAERGGLGISDAIERQILDPSVQAQGKKPLPNREEALKAYRRQALVAAQPAPPALNQIPNQRPVQTQAAAQSPAATPVQPSTTTVAQTPATIAAKTPPVAADSDR